MSYVIGVDVGGTFTDAALVGSTGTIAAKTPSTPPHYSEGVLASLDLLAEKMGTSTRQMLAATNHIAHGTTSSLNALVMGNVPEVGFLCTQGHRDSLFIMNVEGRYLGRAAHELQNPISQTKDHKLIPKRLAEEVTERIDRNGDVVVKLDEDQARAAIRRLLAQGVRAIAVSLLWSFRNDVHENRLVELIHNEDPDVLVATSSNVTPRIREFARHATTIMSTQIAPGLRSYLDTLQAALTERGLTGPLLVMQSNGGAVTAAQAPERAISTVGSVLSGGVVGSVALAGQLGHSNVIATDVGGTTFLVGLVVNGQPVREATTIINHHPINVPTLKVDAIGSGGGAIAWVDAGNNLRIGPHSAQAIPGPACYDQGGEWPTNTDANLVLGILPSRGLLGGTKALSVERAREAIRTKVAEPLGLSIDEAAAAIYAAQTAQTTDLLRKTVIETGRDPRDFVLYAFGGSGPAFCAAYAGSLNVDKVVIPLGAVASAFSAYGLATSDIILNAELSDPTQAPLDSAKANANFKRLEDEVRTGLERQGVDFRHLEIDREIDMRYAMQLAEVPVPVDDRELTDEALVRAVANFERTYAELYGKDSGFREAGVQAITYRVRGTGVMPSTAELPTLESSSTADPADALSETRPVFLDISKGYVETPVYDYTLLRAGHVLPGPAIIEVPTTTAVIPAGFTGAIDHLGNLVITREGVPA